MVYKKIMEFAAELLFPSRCVICEEILPQQMEHPVRESCICASCRKKIYPAGEHFCMRCGKPLGRHGQQKEYCSDCRSKKHEFVQGRGVYIYRGEMIKSMYRFKYSNCRVYAKTYAQEAVRRHGRWLEQIGVEAILPVPLHKKREQTRGYNQAKLLADEIGKLTGIPVIADLFVRTAKTVPQKQLNDEERKNNLKNAFKLSKNSVQLEKVLLVDDIYTTGSTVDAAARTLKDAGIRQIYVLCFCIGEEYSD